MPKRERAAYIREALRLAAESVTLGGGPFGAVIVHAGRIIARGRNRVTETGDPTAHAEILAIREACRELDSFQLDGCEIYCSGEPCPMCLAAIYWARPDAVFFANDRESAARAGFDDAFIYDELGKAPERRAIPMTRLEVPAAADVYRAWLSHEGRVEY